MQPMRVGIDPEKIGNPIHISRTTKNIYERKYISGVVNEMIEHNIVRPSKSDWAFPVVLAKKPNGKLRFCVNYAGLNLRTIPDRYPLPRIDEMLTHLKGKKYLSKIDCLNAFWTIPLHESDKKYSAFRTNEGLFEWNVCPFGMTNIPSAFQRTMDTILAGLKGINCLCYCDDVLIYSESFDQHLKDIRQVVGRLGEAGMTFKTSKCEMFQKEIAYLGFLVSSEGIRPDPEKTKVVREWQRPRTVRGIRAFCGFVNHYRRFIKDCSIKMAPLTQLTRVLPVGESIDVEEIWDKDPRCQKAFDVLKREMLSTPLLRHADPELGFIIDVDSCELGVGAVISQIFEDGKEHPVAYYSKKFSKAEA
jgi:hypothetical protein